MSSTSTRKLEGFQALGGEVPWLNPHAIKIVGLDVEVDKNNWFAFCPRAKDPLEDEWVDDIRKNGVRQPIDGYRSGDTVFMLEGRRRVRAARIVWDEQKKAGVPEDKRINVRCAIHKGSDEYLFSFNVGSENRKQRTTGHRAMLMLNAQKFGADEAALAKMFGCSGQNVKDTLSYFDLSAKLKAAVDGGFAIREAMKIAKEPRDKQDAMYEEMEAAGATKGAKAGNAIRALKAGKKIEKSNSTRMRSKDFLERFRDALGKAYGEAVAVLGFALGEAPSGFDKGMQEAAVAAGWKDAGAKKAKGEKYSKGKNLAKKKEAA